MDKYLENKIAKLQSPDPKTRRAVAEALGRIKRDKNEVVAPLISVLSDQDDDVYQSAFHSLVKIGEEAVLPIIEVFQSQNPVTRYRAIEFFSYVRDIRAIEPLINLLNRDEETNVRVAAAGILGVLAGNTQVEALINALKDRDKYVRYNAAISLGNLHAEQAVQPLIEVLKDEEAEVRGHAAHALGSCGYSDEIVEPLLPLLKDENEMVRLWTAYALHYHGDSRAVDPLIDTLQDESPRVRKTVAEALGTFMDIEGIDKAIKPLVKILQDEVSDVRYAAAEALGRIGTEEVLADLEWLSSNDRQETSDNEKVSEAASQAIQNIEQRYHNNNQL